jgi:PAS domain S-box-containing protein
VSTSAYDFNEIKPVNPACDRYLGYVAGELAGSALDELLAPSVAQEYLDLFSQSVLDPASPNSRGAREVLIRQHDGILRAMDFTLTPIGTEQPLFALMHDITHHKQSENALQRAALVDPLTKIANRRHIEAPNIPNPRSTTSPWVTASLGVATIVPTQLDDIKEFFVQADRAMYGVKEAGRNAVRAVKTGATFETIGAALDA